MGWRGTVRSINSAIRAAERDAKRRQRELERQEVQYQRMVAQEQASYDVDVFNNHIDLITTFHKDCSAPVDWKKIADSSPPYEPDRTTRNYREAQEKLDEYIPEFFDKLFGNTEKKKERLESAIDDARRADEAAYQAELQEHASAMREWMTDVEFAKRILAFDWSAWEEAIKEVQPLSEVAAIASGAHIALQDDHSMRVNVKVRGEDAVPAEQVTLLQSGRASRKKMPVGRFYEIYQDCIASCAIRCAREMFALFPIEKVVVTCTDDLLDTSTGNVAEQAILSVDFRRSTFDNLNFQAIDPSDSLKNFNHNMSFMKTKGFKPVEALE